MRGLFTAGLVRAPLPLLQLAARVGNVRAMAKSLEEAQANYRAADKELLAAKKEFDECHWHDRDKRIKTWKRLQTAEVAYRIAMTEYTPWITGNQGGANIRIID